MILRLLLILLPFSCQAIETSGYFKTFLRHEDANTVGSSQTSLDAVLRVKLSGEPSEATRAELAYEILPLVRRRDPPIPSPITRPLPFGYRADDISSNVINTGADFFLLQNLDRCLIAFQAEHFDMTVGRQPISFGVARAINPIDIIAPFSFDTLDQEERVGVDAVRCIVPTGELSDIDAGVILGKHFREDQSAAFIKYRFNISQTDFVLNLIQFRTSTLLGGSIERGIGGAGWWLETAYVFANAIVSGIAATDYLRLSTGLDYNLRDNLYAYCEYHYNGPGTTKRSNYIANTMQVAYVQGAVYLLGEHYLIPGVVWEINPLLILNTQALINLTDPSLYSFSTLQYSITEDLYLDGGVLFSVGDSGGAPTEFKYYPDQFYLSLRWYF